MATTGQSPAGTGTGDVLIRPAVLSDLPCITAFNCALAKETEDIDLPPETATAGVKAVLEGKAYGAAYWVLEVDSNSSSGSSSDTNGAANPVASHEAGTAGTAVQAAHDVAPNSTADKSSSCSASIQTAGRTVVAQLMTMPEWSDWRAQVVWWVHSVYVHPDHRRAGHFKRLYAFIQKDARAAGAAGLKLYADNHNSRAHAAYEQLGMRTHCRVYEALDTAF